MKNKISYNAQRKTPRLTDYCEDCEKDKKKKKDSIEDVV